MKKTRISISRIIGAVKRAFKNNGLTEPCVWIAVSPKGALSVGDYQRGRYEVALKTEDGLTEPAVLLVVGRDGRYAAVGIGNDAAIRSSSVKRCAAKRLGA